MAEDELRALGNPRSVITTSVPTPATPGDWTDSTLWQNALLMKTTFPAAANLQKRLRVINDSDAAIQIRVRKAAAIDNHGTAPDYDDATYDLEAPITDVVAAFSVSAKAIVEKAFVVSQNYYRIECRRDPAETGKAVAWAILELVADDEMVKRYS